MNNLAISKFAVQELNSKEMIEVDGGFIPVILVGAAMLIEVAFIAAAGDLIWDFNHYVEVGKAGAAAGRAAAK